MSTNLSKWLSESKRNGAGQAQVGSTGQSIGFKPSHVPVLPPPLGDAVPSLWQGSRNRGPSNGSSTILARFASCRRRCSTGSPGGGTIGPTAPEARHVTIYAGGNGDPAIVCTTGGHVLDLARGAAEPLGRGMACQEGEDTHRRWHTRSKRHYPKSGGTPMTRHHVLTVARGDAIGNVARIGRLVLRIVVMGLRGVR